MLTGKKSKLVKLRVTLDEHTQLTALARAEGNLSALVRKQVFGRQDESVRYLVRIHSSLLQIARTATQDRVSLNLTLVLVQLAIIERHLVELLTQAKK